LRLNGVNVKENEHIKIGQYHSLEIELSRPFSVSKECWDSISLDLLYELSNPVKKAEVAALVMEESVAHLCLVQSSMTKTCAKLEKASGKKNQIV
jgi:protein pelota